jgi:hypothetical protein
MVQLPGPQSRFLIANERGPQGPLDSLTSSRDLIEHHHVERWRMVAEQQKEGLARIHSASNRHRHKHSGS